MEEEELLHVNPCPPSWLSDEQKAVLRGDNVEGTAYTQRWLLSTLMTILKALHELLPLLQRDTNLTTYDLTPRKCPGDDPCSQSPAMPQQRPLPEETPTFSPHHADAAPRTPLRDGAADPATAGEGEEDPAGRRLVEVPSDVEDVACQLWDMCSDRHVALHVLQISDSLVLHMLGYALRDPTAPRLTEILCGLVCNLCCQQEGCDAVLADQSLLLLLTSLPERCTDSPALLQAFRLLHRLLYHCRRCGGPSGAPQQPSVAGDPSIGAADGPPHHSAVPSVSAASGVGPGSGAPSLGQADTASSAGLTNGSVQTALPSPSQGGDGSGATGTTPTDPTKALAVALHSCNLEHFLAFILMNSFCEELVSKTVELLEELLFLLDPHTGKFMADFYSESGLVPALLWLVSNWHWQKQRRRGLPAADDEEEEERDSFEVAAASSGRAGRGRDPAAVTTTDTVQKVFVCLYAFVDTKGADAIVSSEDDELRLEPALVHYISELVSVAETELRRHKSHDKPTSPASQPLADDDTDCAHSWQLRQSAERLVYAVKLLELLVRSVSLPEVNLELARLLALLDHSGVYWGEEEDEALDAGISGDDSCGQSREVEGTGLSKTCSSEDLLSTKAIKMTSTSLGGNPMPTLRSKSCEESTSEFKSQQKSVDKKRKDNPNKTKSILDHFDILAAGNSSREEAKGRKKAKDLLQAQNQLEFARQVKLTTGSRCRRRSSILLENSFNDITQVRDAEEISCLSSSTLDELKDLRRSLEEYFSSILHYWFTFGELRAANGALCRLLRVLEQCHVHELLLVLHALRKFDQALVPRVQELLLDHQAFPRIVALLSKLYQ